MNMFTNPTVGPVLTIIFIGCCLAGAVFIIMENWPKITIQKPVARTARYENYMVVDGEIIYPVAVVDHIDKRV